ncbi:MAG: ABC transporter permease [Bacteroidetes bacterium]|nr:ABC transporter permease [Bacteroidota bacterium]
MIKNYFKNAFRNLWKRKGNSFLNITGLAIGIACAGLIFLWVEDEISFDQFNTKNKWIYNIRENQKYDSYIATFDATPAPLAPAMLSEIPGIANTCRIGGNSAQLISIGNKSIYASGSYVDASLFDMFSFPFVQGKAATSFSQLYSLVITETAAKKFFGNEENVIGKSVRMNNKQDYVISGVIKDIPRNSSLRFEWVAPFKIWYNQNSFAQYWGNNCLSTFVELKPNVSPASITKLLTGFIQKRERMSNAEPFLFSMNDWHLRNQFDNGKQTGGGAIEYVHLFSIIAWIILLIACINFMNLATARSEKRAKEVGVRKVLGAVKQNLIFQFISEALLMSFMAAVLAVIIIALALPSFNSLVQKNLSLELTKPIHIIALLVITLLSGLIAGSYPSLYLSSFNPVFVLKGLKLKTGSVEIIRKGLVILQFSVSIILIISTVIIFQQIQHVKNRNLGFNKNNLLEFTTNDEFNKNYEPIKQELLNSGVIENLALSDYAALYGGNNGDGLVWAGKPANSSVLISNRSVSPGFFSTYGIKILEGRDFVESDSVTSKKTSVIITQSLEKLMGAGTAIGKTMHYRGDTSGTEAVVVGVVNDFIYGNMYGKPDPVTFYCAYNPSATQMYVHLKPTDGVEDALQKIESVIKKYNPSYPVTYQFVDDQFNKMFLNEALISKLSRVFAALAIFISCLGLFGLAAYTAERSTKEIGVRKVLGASVAGITTLLSADFLKLIVISCVIAFPLAWWIIHNWLQNYKYRIDISWWVFFAAGFAAIMIALITISFQSIKAAIANPVKSLRTE